MRRALVEQLGQESMTTSSGQSQAEIDPRIEQELPPRELSEGMAWARRVLLATGLLFLLGLWAGSLGDRQRAEAVARAFQALVDADGSDETRAALEQLRLRRLPLSHDLHARLMMAQGYFVAAERLPWRRPLHTLAAAELESPAADAPPFLECERLRLRAAALSELDRPAEALAILLQAKAVSARLPDGFASFYRQILANDEAYLLALLSDDPETPGRNNPARAVALAESVVGDWTPRPDGRRASEVAAYVDTLAACYRAAGRSADAARASEAALGLAEAGELAVHLKQYDACRP